MKSIIGVLVAPFAPVLVILIPLVSGRAGLDADFGIVIYPAYTVAFLSIVLVGLPVVYILERRNLKTMPMLLACGFAAGVLCWALFLEFITTWFGSGLKYDLLLVVVGGGFGFITSLTYGLVTGVRWTKGTNIQKKKNDFKRSKPIQLKYSPVLWIPLIILIVISSVNIFFV